MDHPVIPAPVRFDGGRGRFALRPGTKISCAATDVEPVVGRFCSETTRRTGLRLAPVTGEPVPDEPSIRIELANGMNSLRSRRRWVSRPPVMARPTSGTRSRSAPIRSSCAPRHRPVPPAA
jgi:hypothetical protein